MPVDISIYQNLLRPPKSVAEYDAEAQSLQQNKLTLQMGQMKADEYTRGLADQNKLRGVVAGFGADTNANYNALLGAGRLAEAQKYAKENGELAKTVADTKHTEAQTAETHVKAVNLKMGQARDMFNTITTPEQAAQLVRGMYADPDLGKLFAMKGDTAEAAVARIPTDPAQFAQWVQAASLNAEKLATYRTPDANTVASNAQSNANSLRSAASSKYSADSSAASARRGQDMTDSRTREFNATRVEENKIKREAKDDVNKMTRSSQIASFDTMLGTLDRLGKHSGLSRSVGLTGKFPTMPGSDSANFQAELETFQSQAFIPMVSQLKGMGALSDAEGRKLTAAVGALNPSMGEKAFRDSISRITADMESAKKRLQGVGATQAPAGGVPDDIAALLAKHGGKK